MMKKAIMAAACLLALAQGLGSAQEMRDTVRAAKVFPKSMANALMAKAARHFGKTYAKDYITQASFSRIIRSKGIPCKIYLTRGLWLSSAFTQNYKGLYFDEPNDMGRYVPTDSFVSLFFLPGRTDPIDIPYVNENNLNGFEACLVNYSESFPYEFLWHKRALEIWGPLNYDMRKCFSFHITEEYETNGKKYYVIGFETKERKFPGKTKILAEGEVYVSEDGDVSRISTRDMEDRYSCYIHDKSKTALPPITRHTYSVCYAVRNGFTYTSSVSQSVRWVEPEDKTKSRYYQRERNPYRNPFKYGFSTTTEVSFSEPVILDKRKLASIEKAFHMGSEIVWYTPDPDLSGWKTFADSRPDVTEALKTLDRPGYPLDAQANESAKSEWESKLESRKTRTRVDDSEEYTKYYQELLKYVRHLNDKLYPRK
jgi:hypothetical protein